jgi:hypothetical protein
MDKDYLIHLLTLDETSLYKHLRQTVKPSHECEGLYLYVHKDDNLPCLVAHIDTVHKQKPKKKHLWEFNNVLFNVMGGLGADDRAGVYALLQLKDLPYNLLFTNLEEIGGIGVKQALHDIPDLLSLNTCFIEIDRKGTGHYVDYVGAEQEFLNLFKNRGLRPEWGSYSDIFDLSDELSIASVNLACGYYDQHTKKESLNLKELQAVIDFLKDEELIKELTAKQYKTEPKKWLWDYDLEPDVYRQPVDYYEEIYRMYRDYYGTFDKYWL